MGKRGENLFTGRSSCGGNHVVKKGESREKQECLCRNRGRFLEGASLRQEREGELKMYANGMSMRSPGPVPLGTVFTWIKGWEEVREAPRPV
ncbi:insertion element protein [Metallosphaera sedula]|nr:insertion element protein [Metallosphaera sedula]